MSKSSKKAISPQTRRSAQRDRLTLGATLAFVAVVAGPFAITAITAGLCFVKLGTVFVTFSQVIRIASWRRLNLLPSLLSVLFTVGTFVLTERRRDASVSDGLRTSARILAVATMLATLVAIIAFHVALRSRDFNAYFTLEEIRDHTCRLSDLPLALVAARLFAERGEHRRAMASSLLAGALLVTAIGFLMLRRTATGHDVLHQNGKLGYTLIGCTMVALWLGKLVVLWQLRRTLQKPEEATIAEVFA
jgi:hypothetical protein